MSISPGYMDLVAPLLAGIMQHFAAQLYKYKLDDKSNSLTHTYSHRTPITEHLRTGGDAGPGNQTVNPLSNLSCPKKNLEKNQEEAADG